MKEWEAIEAKIVQLEPTDESRELFQKVTSYYGQVVELDSQGRLMLPQVLRQDAGLTGDVNVLGMLTYLDVTNKERFEASQKGAAGKVEMSREKQSELAQKTKALNG